MTVTGGGQKLKFDSNIYFGYRTPIKEHAFQVIMINNGSLCSGSIIGSRTVVTAAHCVDDTNPAHTALVIGTDRLQDKIGTKMDVLKFIVHEHYVAEAFSNDIALAFLVHNVPFGPSVQRIVLSAPSMRLAAGMQLTVSGWGRTETMDYSRHLLQTELNYLSKKACREYIWRAWEDTLTASMFCLVGRRQDGCDGDSGGPVVRAGLLYGLVSFGYGCGTPGMPSIYTNVSHLYDWIQSNVERFHKEHCTPLDSNDLTY